MQLARCDRTIRIVFICKKLNYRDFVMTILFRVLSIIIFFIVAVLLGYCVEFVLIETGTPVNPYSKYIIAFGASLSLIIKRL